MNVKIVSHSQAPYNDALHKHSALDLIAYCARVSNPNNQNNIETNEKLVKYLMKHKHWSPLEMVSACLEIETTRDIARQILRHRSFSFQEFSQRYADPTQDLSFEIREARLQDLKNRQNSIKTDNEELELEWRQKQEDLIRQATDTYTWAIENGIAKEQARAVLPEGNTMSRMYVNGTLRSWIHYIELRGANGTQQEHIDIAHAVADVIANIFPLAEEFKGKEI
jgi:thymidylate synthase (FAD)|tara:strand:+ start:905 stop:1576 length:672 start_codon:yes stop_codon:yes gene_type:complete